MAVGSRRRGLRFVTVVTGVEEGDQRRGLRFVMVVTVVTIVTVFAEGDQKDRYWCR